MLCKNCISSNVCSACKELELDKAVKMLDFKCKDYKGIDEYIKVIRCKECEYSEYKSWCNKYQCKKQITTPLYEKDFYCGDGKRKEFIR